MDVSMARLEKTGERWVLRFERRLAHSPEKVWRAITDPAELAHWFPARVETELRVGAPMRFIFDEGSIGAEATEATPAFAHGEILELEPPRLFVYRWGSDELRWEIIPDGSGSRLLFSQTLRDKREAARDAAGWDICLDVLGARLDGRTAEPGSWFGPTERYVETFGLAEGEVHERPDGYLVRFERDFVQPPADIWAALVEHNTPSVGGEPPVRATNQYMPAGTLTAIDPPGLLAYEWLDGGAPVGQVCWELRASPLAGTRLVLSQTLPGWLATLRATALAAWQTHLEIFFATVAGVDKCRGQGWARERTDELTRMYAERL